MKYILLLLWSVCCIGKGGCYTVSQLQEMTITQPYEVLALLDSAEQKSQMTLFDINRLRCLAYHNGLSDFKRALRYALRAYDAPSARKNPEEFLRLVEIIADEYHEKGDYANSVRYCSEGLALAKETANRTSEVNLSVTLALNLREMSQQEEAYRQLRLAIRMTEEMAQKSTYWGDWDDHVHALGITISAFCEDGRYDDAIALRPVYEKAMEGLGKCNDLPEGLVDMRLSSGYAAYAYMYRLKGDSQEADKLYRLLCDTRFASTPDGEQMRIPYLIASQRYTEVLHYLVREKQYWQAHSDTVSYDYINSHLNYERQIYEGMNDFRSANRVQGTIVALMDTLRERERQEDALELAEIYKSNEQARQIEQQTASIRLRNVILLFVIVFLLAAIVFMVRMFHYNRTIRRKNDAMMKTIDELMSYKDELLVRQEENIRLKETVQALQETPEEPCVEVVDKEEVMPVGG